MQKDFDRWNIKKKELDTAINVVDFHEREIWWCSIGVNVGFEQHSQTSDFSRPVIIVKKFTRDMFLGIPLTTQTRQDNFRVCLNINGVDNDALVLQMRAYDRKRLVRKIGMMPKENFTLLKNYIKSHT